jgi:hypothetical protein
VQTFFGRVVREAILEGQTSRGWHARVTGSRYEPSRRFRPQRRMNVFTTRTVSCWCLLEVFGGIEAT